MASNASRKAHPGFTRNIKVIGLVVFLCVCGVVALLASRKSGTSMTASEIPNVDGRGGKRAPESPHYTQALKRANSDELAKAEQTGTSFVPSLSDRVGPDSLERDLQNRTSAAAAIPERIDYQHPGGAPQTAQGQQLPALPPPSAGLLQQVQTLATQWDNPPQQQEILGIQKKVEADPAATVKATPAQTEQANRTQTSQPPIILAGDRFYGHLETGIDTAVSPEVSAIIDQGPCKDARLMGAGKLTNEAVGATFSTMTCKGKSVSITAIALNEETFTTSLPADLDRHIVERVAIPGILGALGSAGSTYSNAGSTVTQNPLGGVTQVNNPNPSTKQLVGAGVAGGIQGMQGVIQQQAAAMPTITGKVKMGTTVLIQFKTDVSLP